MHGCRGGREGLNSLGWLNGVHVSIALAMCHLVRNSGEVGQDKRLEKHSQDR